MPGILTFFTNIWGGLSATAIKIIAILAIVIGIYFYWHHLENTITALTANNAALQQANQADNQTIQVLQKDFASTQKQLNDLNNSYNQITTDADNINKIIINLPIGISAKDKLKIEKQINQLINKIFSNLNLQTDPKSFQ